jgi:hypothetical protein
VGYSERIAATSVIHGHRYHCRRSWEAVEDLGCGARSARLRKCEGVVEERLGIVWRARERALIRFYGFIFAASPGKGKGEIPLGDRLIGMLFEHRSKPLACIDEVTT